MRILAGWLDGVRQVPTPAFNARPPGTAISLIVIHCICLPPHVFGGRRYIDDLFLGTLDPGAHPYFAAIAGRELSTHIFIDRAGSITQYVSFLDRAWHAGRSSYHGKKECNDFGIGIELEGADDCLYTKSQYDALIPLVRLLQRTYPDIGSRIAGHSEVAPGRKTDPGPYFDFATIR